MTINYSDRNETAGSYHQEKAKQMVKVWTCVFSVAIGYVCVCGGGGGSLAMVVSSLIVPVGLAATDVLAGWPGYMS